MTNVATKRVSHAGKMGRPRLADIAAMAGVAPSTVADILNGRPGCYAAAKTRERVLMAAHSLRYRPNMLARGLRGGRTQSLGILWALCTPMHSSGLLERIAVAAQQRDYVTHIGDHLAGVHPDHTRQLLAEHARRGEDALILQWFPVFGDDPEVVRLLRQFPAVLLVSPHPLETPYDLIVHDRNAGIGEAVAYWAAAGRKRPCLLAVFWGNDSKVEAFRGHLARHGLPADADSALDIGRMDDAELGDASRVMGRLEEACRTGLPFDALLGIPDVMAAAAMTWLRSRGWRVPEDVAVAGFNDDVMCPWTLPPLASVAREEPRLAERAVAMIFRRLDMPGLPPQREHLPMRFVRRESAG